MACIAYAGLVPTRVMRTVAVRTSAPGSATRVSWPACVHRQCDCFLERRAWKAIHVAEFTLSSSAFAPRQPIPARHTCDGEDASPPLEWSNLPEGTRALVLIVDDPDAPGGTFTHWLAWGLDPQAGGGGASEPAPGEGRNDFDVAGYRCPW